MHDNNGKIVKIGTILYLAYGDHFVKTYWLGLLIVFFFHWFLFFWGGNASKELEKMLVFSKESILELFMTVGIILWRLTDRAYW